jgi:hypothetical protein
LRLWLLHLMRRLVLLQLRVQLRMRRLRRVLLRVVLLGRRSFTSTLLGRLRRRRRGCRLLLLRRGSGLRDGHRRLDGCRMVLLRLLRMVLLRVLWVLGMLHVLWVLLMLLVLERLRVLLRMLAMMGLLVLRVVLLLLRSGICLLSVPGEVRPTIHIGLLVGMR